MEIGEALALIRPIPDYPKPGILFQDITPLLAHGEAFNTVNEHLASFVDKQQLIAGIEARGFIFAAAIASSTGNGFIPIRKAGKLPYKVFSQNYGLEYRTDILEIHVDAISSHSDVLLIDDVLATGGTIEAAIELIARAGGKVDHVITLLEIQALNGRQRLLDKFPHIRVTSLIVY
jgi:adenine phosphoribosyltransferase